MADRHVTALFAPAYDGRLDDGQRRRFEDHLASCEKCALAYAEQCAAADALRSLPAARMPVAVRLPSYAPRAEHRSLRERLGLQSRIALTLAGAAAAVLIGGVTLALHNSSQPNLSTQAQLPAFAGGASNASTSASSSGTAAGAEHAAGALAPSSTAFTNAVTVQRSGRPGEVLVLATTQQSYAAGTTVQVDARLVFSQVVASTAAPAPAQGAPPARAGQSSSVQDLAIAPVAAEPAVTLLSPGVTGQQANNAPAASPSPIAVAVSAGSPGLFQLTIPANARPGDILTIVATVPAGVPSSGDAQPVTAVLQIVVA